MTFSDIVTRVCNRTNKNVNDTSGAVVRIKNHINDACQEAWDGFEWSFRHREYPLTTVADVTSGTVTATNGSRTVTASGTPFDTTNHVGAWIRFTADSPLNWYRVLAVASTSSLTIEPAYQGTTGSGKSYELKKIDYLWPSELIDLKNVRVTYTSRSIPIAFMSDLSELQTPPLTRGVPISAAIFDSDSIGTTYTTGTVTGTINTNTLTGAGTLWLSNLTPGDTITIGSNTYTIQKVNSDTSITLYNALKVAASTSSYTGTRRFGRNIRFLPSANDVYTVFILGLRKFAPLVNDNDRNELIERYPYAVIEGAVWRELSSSPDSREDSIYQKSELLWDKAKAEDRSLTKRTSIRPVWSPRGR